MKCTFVLCEGRHDVPGNPPAIFPHDVGMDTTELIRIAQKAIPELCEHLTVFTTGFTPAMLAVVRVCWVRRISLTAMHYDRETGKYVPQTVFEYGQCPFCGGQIAAHEQYCPHCGAN